MLSVPIIEDIGYPKEEGGTEVDPICPTEALPSIEEDQFWKLITLVFPFLDH